VSVLVKACQEPFINMTSNSVLLQMHLLFQKKIFFINLRNAEAKRLKTVSVKRLIMRNLNVVWPSFLKPFKI